MKKIKLSVLALTLIGGLLLTGCKNENDSTDPSSAEESSSGSETTEISSSSLETHTITFDSHGGSEVPYQVVEHGGKITKPQDPTKLGYEFVNWTYKGDEWSFVDFIVTEDMTLDANWNIVNYSITYNLNGGINNEQNPTTYTVEDSVTLYDPTRVGYTFDGWFDDENNRITHLGQTIVGNFTLTARWSANLNNLSIASSDETKGTVAIVSGSGYSDETIINALKETLSKGKKSLRSVDKTLLSWSNRDDIEKEGHTSLAPDWDKNLEETIRIAKTPWLDDLDDKEK